MFMKKKYVMQSLIDFGQQHIYVNNHDDDEYQLICSKQMDETMRNFIQNVALVVFGFSVAIIGPIYSYFFQNIRSTTIEVRVPFTEANSDEEFVCNLTFMALVGILGAPLYIGLEVMMSTFRDIIVISPKLVEHRIKSLIADYLDGHLSDAQLRFAFTDAIKQSMDADE